ncbi:MAG: hypothetical protein K2K80_01650, partial [Clostridia bacterium]|nr:hypothetical protein [Clostridia bacterium]
EIPSMLLADTGARLASVKIKFTKLWAYILVAVLSVGIAVAAPFVPLKPGEAEDPPYVISDWQDEALAELIEYVRKSDADEQTKTGTVAEISSLAKLKESEVTTSEMETFVNFAADNIRTVYDNANLSYRVEEGEEEPEEYRIQRQINTVVGEYAIAKLYEIFDITPPENGGSTPEKPGTDPNDPNNPGSDPSDPNNPGGELIGAQEKFFDPELGYISYSQVLDKYYAVIGDAMDDGVISTDEWFSIVLLYYQMLGGAN